jgi:hypothetical protein
MRIQGGHVKGQGEHRQRKKGKKEARLVTALRNERQCEAQKQSIKKITPVDASLDGLGSKEKGLFSKRPGSPKRQGADYIGDGHNVYIT